MLVSLLAVGLGLAARVLAQEAACYAPNGELADNETYVPCNKLGINQAGVFSSCCALDGPPDQRDICSSSGLCINRQDQPQRGFCTDKTWKSKACNHVCTDIETGGNPGSISFMTACNDGTGKYCCGKSNTTCCGTNAAFSISTQESVCTANSTNSDGSTVKESSTSKGATIGLAVATAVSLLAGLLSTIWLWRQNKKLKKELAEKADTPSQPIEPQFTGATGSYAGASPQPTYKTHYSTSPPPPMSPNSEHHQGNIHRYSELDASAAVARSEMGSPSPYDQPQQQGRDSPAPGQGNGHGHGSYGSPMHSPNLPQS